MFKCCQTCAFYILQTYQHEFLDIGRCTHLAFFKSGFARVKENGSVEFTHKSRRDRLDIDVINSLFDEGWSYFDTLDMKNELRHCEHWISCLSYGRKAIDHYGFNPLPDWVNKFVKNYFEQGCPTKKIHLEKFKNYHRFSYEYDEVEEEFLEYNPCVFCENFIPEKNPEGSPIPFLGECVREKLDDILNLNHKNKKLTLSFLSCDYFVIKRKYKLIDFDSYFEILSEKIHPFIETNPVDVSVSELQHRFRFPLIWRRFLLNKEEHERLLNLDLHENLMSHMDFDRFKEFSKEMGLDCVMEYFNKRLKINTKKEREFWNKFSSYGDTNV